ncbi:MAG: hypothetical protein ACE148_06280 [Vicinamibacterales bacterium]
MAWDQSEVATAAGASEVIEPVPAPEAPRASMAVQKFKACRWRRPAENGDPECCGHRDVLPLTGVHGFDPDAWCEECRFFKLRRVPRKSLPVLAR